MSETGKDWKPPLTVTKYALILAAAWTVLVAAMVLWGLRQEMQDQRELIRSDARAHFLNDKAFRFWADKHWGHDLPPIEDMRPNPYLSNVPDSDVVTAESIKVTLMNLAYVDCRLMEDYEELYGIKGRIVSLNPDNPQNTPDEWERAALESFERGETEAIEFAEIDGEPYLRMMRPLIVRKMCLECHGQQGYKEGDVRGGEGMSIPEGPFFAHARMEIAERSLVLGLLWLLGLVALTISARHIQRRGLQRDRAEEDNARLSRAIEQADETIVITDAEGTIQYVNPAFEKTTGYTTKEAIGQNPRILKSGLQDEAFYRGLWDTITDGKTWTGRFINQKKDSTLYTEEATISPVYSDTGDIVSYVAVKRDITDELQHETRHKELQKKLDRAEKMESLGILAGGVAHDLNNMLGPVVGYSELILRDIPEDDKLSQRVSRISKSASDAADVIQDLLTLARRGRYEMKPIDLNEVIDSYVDSPGHQKLMESRSDICFELNLDRSISKMSGSSPHLAKVVMNLVVNACDAMPEGGSLTVSTSQQFLETLPGGHNRIDARDYLILRVRDTGMGIDDKDLDKIFEPYYSKKKMGTSGSGLGLSVVYGVVRDHRGYYDIFSKVGEGTEFVLYFSVTKDTVQEKLIPESDIRGNQTVLIVDDVKEQLEVTADMLSSLGYQVSTAGTGQEAVRYLGNHTVDVVVQDMILEPGYDGLDTFLDILKLHPNQKAIIVSGYCATERVREMQTLGAGAFIRKPFTVEVLGMAIRSELDRKTTAASIKAPA